MIKNLSLSYIPKIVLLFNNISKFSYFPVYWKTAIPSIFKSSKPPGLPTSYHSIFLLNSIRKLTEVFKLSKFSHTVILIILGIRNSLFSENRFLRSTKVIRLVKHTTTGIMSQDFTAAVILVIEKEFDKYWIFGIIYKLINYNSPLT